MSSPSAYHLSDYRPGALSLVCAMQSEYYAKAWQFSPTFEIRLMAEMSAFFQAYNADKDLFKIAIKDDVIIGAIAIQNHTEVQAQLRFFIVAEQARGLGVGKTLLSLATELCETTGYRCVFLWTFEGLGAARHLYEQFGFKLVETKPDSSWAQDVEAQRFELAL